MSKAFDRVEGDFIEKIQINMGFPESWVRLIVECDTIVRYQVKLNNVVT